MAIMETNTVANTTMAPEIEQALNAIDLPEVQDLIRKLGQYNLGVCIPHMHRLEQDFSVLPSDTVQIEENCKVRWMLRSELSETQESVPVAWRWIDDAVHPHAACWQYCYKDPAAGHTKDHAK